MGRKERGAGGWPIHSECRHGWILTEDTGLCSSYVLIIIKTKRKHAKQMSLCLKKKIWTRVMKISSWLFPNTVSRPHESAKELFSAESIDGEKETWPVQKNTPDRKRRWAQRLVAHVNGILSLVKWYWPKRRTINDENPSLCRRIIAWHVQSHMLDPQNRKEANKIHVNIYCINQNI